MREPLQIGTAWGAPIRRVGFIKSDQTRGNSPVSWLPPHGNHFLPCHSSLSWLNSAPFVIVLRTSSSLGRLSVYRLSLLVDTKAGKQGEKQHRCVMKRRKHTVWPCAQERAHVAGQTYSMSVCVCVCVLCPSSIQQKKRLIFKIYFFCLHTGQSYFTIFCWQEQIKKRSNVTTNCVVNYTPCLFVETSLKRSRTPSTICSHFFSCEYWTSTSSFSTRARHLWVNVKDDVELANVTAQAR